MKSWILTATLLLVGAPLAVADESLPKYKLDIKIPKLTEPYPMRCAAW